MNSEGNKLYVLCKGAVSQLSSLVHFLITTNHTSLLATKIDKLLENDKSQPRTCQTNMSPKHFFQRRKQQNDEWTLKNCHANMFSKSKIADSVSVFFKFVHPCLLLYLLCYSYVRFTPFGGTKFPIFEFWYLSGSLYVSGKLPTYPSPKPTFFPKWEESVKFGLAEGLVGGFQNV